MKKLLPLAAAFALFIIPGAVLADTVTINATTTAANTNITNNNPTNSNYSGGSSQFDLDHHYAYTWKITGLGIPAGQTITSAQLTFKNIANWDTNANRLFVHLLNTANNSGIASVEDNNPNDNSLSDYFGGSNSLGPSFGVNNIELFETGFNMVGQNGYQATNYVFTFSAAQLATLQSYINAGGDIAFGFDPDCHYWNNGITLTYATTPTPEPVSMLLLGTGLAGLYVRRRRQTN